MKRYLEGTPTQRVPNLWTDINPVKKTESLGYRTQKPATLLERIIEASSNENDVVFDPFCGCGTTLEAAQRLNRRWIGIDIAIHAVKHVSKVRLVERCGLVEGARDLLGTRQIPLPKVGGRTGGRIRYHETDGGRRY